MRAPSRRVPPTEAPQVLLEGTLAEGPLPRGPEEGTLLEGTLPEGIVDLRLLWPHFGSRKRTLKKGRFLVAPVAPGSGCRFFQLPTSVTGAACMDASEPKGHGLNLPETI